MRGLFLEGLLIRLAIIAVALLCEQTGYAQSLTKAQTAATIAATVKSNGQRQITGPILQTNLLNMLGIAATWGQGAWANNVTYSSGEIVLYNNAVWIGDSPIAGDAPGSVSGQWSVLSPAPGTGLAISGSNLNLSPASISSIGGVKAINQISHEWVAWIDTDGTPHLLQPSFSDIGGTLAPNQCPILSATAAGCAPPSGGGTTNFLRADGTWQPAGGGVVTPIPPQEFTGCASGCNYVPGTTTSLTLSPTPTASISVSVYFNGVREPTSAFSVSGAMLSFAGGSAIPPDVNTITVTQTH